MRATYLFTSESVSEGHPDKVSDQISDAIVDLFLSKDPRRASACETLTTTPAGGAGRRDPLQGRLRERSRGPRVRSRRSRTPCATRCAEIGYEQDGFHWQTLTFENTSTASRRTSRRASTPSGNKTRAPATRASCSAIACDETPDLMPATLDYSHKILERMAADRHSGAAPFLEPDAKSQVTLQLRQRQAGRGDRDRRLDPARQGLTTKATRKPSCTPT
jgi:S-adenosylmethionine synthetase